MTHIEFSLLSRRERYKLMLEFGVQVAEREIGFNKYLLYQIDSFYVERRVNILAESERSVRSFETTQRLAPYLRHINIKELL